MSSNISSDPDAGIRVSITPSQSAYFAGEPFSVTITFTNTRNLEPGPSKPSSAFGHKRGAHSISSAPLSKPPTSPGTPRTTPAALATTRARNSPDAPTRRGFVGNASDLTLDQRRRRLQGKSLSVSIAPPDLDAQLSRTPLSGRSFNDSATSFHRSPLVPSSLPRMDSFPLSQNHPHARKQSIVDYTPEVSSPLTPTSSRSSFSSGLDSISEASMSVRLSYPNTPILGSPSIEPASPSNFQHGPAYGYPSTPIGLGHPPRRPQANTELILYSYAQLAGSVVITPVSGVSTTSEQNQTLQHIRESLLKRTVVGGGSMDINSTMLSSAEHPTSPTGVAGRQISMSTKGHGRSSSLTGALFSMLSPSSLVGSFSSPPASPQPSPSISGPPGHRWRSSSVSGDQSPITPNGPTSRGLGLGLGLPTHNGAVPPQHRVRQDSIGAHSRRSSVSWMGSVSQESGASATSDTCDDGSALPTFEVQPAMLAVDLALAPGESKSYTYTVNLPDNLPPTFRGKAIRFSYELVVGLCRASQSGGLFPAGHDGNATPTSGGPSANVSKLMKVPIRLYNNVVVDRAPKPYNLLWPVDKRRDLAMPSSQAKVVENDDSSHVMNAISPSIKSPMSKGKTKTNGFEDLVRYTKRLLETLPEPEPEVASPSQIVGAPLTRVPRRQEIFDPPLSPSTMDDKSVSASSHSFTSTSPPPHSRSSLDTSPAGSEKDASEGVVPAAELSSTLSSLPPLPPSPTIQPGSQVIDDANLPASGPGAQDTSVVDPPASASSDRDIFYSLPATPTNPSTTSNDQSEPRAFVPRSSLRNPIALETDFSRDKEDDDDLDSNDGDPGLAGGCREAVEILTRSQKKASYDVTKDGIKVAILTFPKSSYRLGETISGIVEINERRGRSRVLQLAAFLEAHESLPSSLLSPAANRRLRRTYAQHHSSSLMNTLRTTFSLDIPSDSSPAFQTCVGTPHAPNTPGGTTSFGGVEWKVRLCLLVAVASDDTDTGTEGVRFKGLVRDGPRGEWGSGWKALPVACPLAKHKRPRKGRPASLSLGSGANGSARGSREGFGSPLGSANYSARSTSWTAFFASYLSPSMEREYHDGDEMVDEDEHQDEEDHAEHGSGGGTFGGSTASFSSDDTDEDGGYDGIKPDFAGGVGKGVDFGGGEEGWRNVRLEMVECEVPVRVWPGNTAFKAMDVVFEV